MRQVRQIMGMPIGIDIPGCDTAQPFNWAFARLRQIDNKFSTYKPDSEVSRYIRSEINEANLSPELKNIIRACRGADKKTDGYFSAWAAGSFDPSGYVKSWAIAEAAEIIEKAGFKTYCIGAGGDILARSNTDKIWNIGIQDPNNTSKILNMLSISNGAVATSGNYERGTHIINPKTKRPADGLLSVSITGPDIIWADVLATAVFAMGKHGLDFMETQPSYQAQLVTVAGEVIGDDLVRANTQL
jgi:thiamine biosynthesis lipoprotein